MQNGLTRRIYHRMDFYSMFFWELALIPIWFICLIWGGENRAQITLVLFVYTLGQLLENGLIDVYLKHLVVSSFNWQI